MKTMHLLILVIAIMIVIPIQQSFALGINTMPGSSISSPIQQFKSGIPLQKVQCRNNLVLVIREETGTPACLFQSDVSKLVFRHWAQPISVQPKPQYRIVGPYDGLENQNGIVTIQNKTFFMTTFNGTLDFTRGPQKITFHDINFTLYPLGGLSLEVSGTLFYADVGFRDGMHEQLGLNPTINTDMGNITITRLSQHENPQAGIVSYNEQIKLLVSVDESTNILTSSPQPLKLYLSTSSQVIKPGQAIGITVSINNTLPKQITVGDENSWKVNYLSSSPCTRAQYGIAVLDGFYSEQNMTEGKPLTIFNPGILCPGFNKTTQSYVFEPASGHAASSNCRDFSCQSGFDMGNQYSFNGIWYHGKIQPFSPGLYTVIGGDEWGNVSIEHFVVSNSTIFAGNLGSMSCPMRYDGVQFSATIKNYTGFANYYNSTEYRNTLFLHPGMNGTITIQYHSPADAAWFENNDNAPFNMTNGAALFYMANVTNDKNTISYAASLYNDNTGHHSQICHYATGHGGFADPCNRDNTGDIPRSELSDASRLLHVGMETSFEPGSVMMYPDTNPTFTATVSASKDAMPGTYWLSLQWSLCGPGVLAKLVVLP